MTLQKYPQWKGEPSMTDKSKTDAVLIKEFFGMSASETIAALKELSSEDKQQLGDGIRNGSLTY